MKMFKKALALVMAAAMLFTFAACGGATANNTEFVIGFSGPLTGPAAVYGEAVKNVAQMAVDEINAAGGLDGVNFKLVALDDKHDASKVAANFTSLMEGGMQVSLGTVTTGPGLEFSKLSNDDKVFFLTPSASGDKIPEFDNGFQMCFADGNQGKVAAEFVNGLGKNKIGIFYKSDDPYSKGIYDQFKANLKDGIQTVETVFTAANETDFSAQISQLKECDFIFMPIYYQPASVFMTQAKGQIADNATYYGCDGFDGLAGQIDLSTIPQEVSMLSHFDSNAKEGAAADFVKKYTAKFGAETLNQFGASAYDCVYAIFGALKELKAAGKDINVTMTAEELYGLMKAHFAGDFSYSGVTGTDITWEDNGYVHKAAVKFVLKEADK
ncbi:MAG: ABC transporter substrate-binding protein [Acutalibacteraceae bacterium]|nr:ABC transporter substrate-binding protein [Acutalibacteraceae bacterium]